MTECEFAQKIIAMLSGRICKLDHCYCSNFNEDELVEKCPTLKAHKQGEPVGKTPNLDYKGIPHVIRTGRYGDFVTGMPPEYLTGNVKAKKQNEQ